MNPSLLMMLHLSKKNSKTNFKRCVMVSVFKFTQTGKVDTLVSGTSIKRQGRVTWSILTAVSTEVDSLTESNTATVLTYGQNNPPSQIQTSVTSMLETGKTEWCQVRANSSIEKASCLNRSSTTTWLRLKRDTSWILWWQKRRLKSI